MQNNYKYKKAVHTYKKERPQPLVQPFAQNLA